MQNFFLSIEERIIIAKAIKFFAISISVLFYYYKTHDIVKVSIMLFIGYLGAEFISIVETFYTTDLPFNLKMIYSSGVRNSGGFLFVFIMYVFDKKSNTNYYYAIVSAFIGMLLIGKWHCFVSADGCYGIPTDSILGVKMYGLKPTFQKVHPVPIYDSFIGLLSLITLIYTKKRFDILKVSFMGILLFALQGFIMEFLRINTKIVCGLTINQIVYLIIIFLLPLAYYLKNNQGRISFQSETL